MSENRGPFGFRRLTDYGPFVWKENPGRPTKEFWDKVYPNVLKGYLKKYDEKKAENLARLTTGSIWYHKIKPKTKAMFETIRERRENIL